MRLALKGHGFDIVAEAVDAYGAVAAALEHRPDLCLLDVHMPGGGVAAAAQLSDALPEMPIVMLSVSDADEDLFEALHAGACGYLLKDTDPSWLPAALRGVFNGEAPLPRALAARLIREFQRRGRATQTRDAQGRVVFLSARESEVLALLRAAFSTNEIARRLGVSPATVRRHLSETMRKLGVASRDAALEATTESTPHTSAAGTTA